MASQVFSFLLGRNYRIFPSNALTLRNLRNVLGAASRGRLSLSFSTGPKLPGTLFKRFKLSETFQIGSWYCQLWQVLQLPAVASQVFPFSIGPKLQDTPFKRSKPSETCEIGSWSCQLWQAKSFLFYWPEITGWTLQMLQTLRNLPNRLLELPAMAGQICSFLLARNYRMLPSNASNPPKPSKSALGAAKLWAMTSQVFPLLLVRILPSFMAPIHGNNKSWWDCRISLNNQMPQA